MNTLLLLKRRLFSVCFFLALTCPALAADGPLALLLAVTTPSTSGLIGIFIWVAIAALVVWGIIALVKWSGIPIPQPVWIVLTVLLGIALILFIARMFGLIS